MVTSCSGFLEGSVLSPSGEPTTSERSGEVIVGYIWASPVSHANGVPLKSCAVCPSVPSGYAGVIHAAIRAVLRFFQAFYGVIAMLPVAVVSGI